MPAEKNGAKSSRKPSQGSRKPRTPRAATASGKINALSTWLPVAVIAVLGSIFLMLMPPDVASSLLSAIDKSASNDVRQSARRSRTMAEGPPVVWIRFDDRALQQLAPPDRQHIVPREAVARLLDRIREGPRPRLLFLDVAIGETVVPEQAALDEALGRWRAAAAPPMAVFAGRGCGTVLGGSLQMSGSAEASYFAPHYSRWITTLGGPSDDGDARRTDPSQTSQSATNIIWSCPLFAGLEQMEFGCATVRLRSGRSETVAIPSPARFAAGAQSGRLDTIALRNQISEATLLCRGGSQGTEFARYLTPVHLAHRNEQGGNLLTQTRVGGRPLLSVRSAAEILQADADLDSLAGAIVVIGGGSSWSPDIVPTEDGGVNGSVLVGFALRQALIFGTDTETGRVVPILVFFVALLMIRLLTLWLPTFRNRAMGRWPRASFFSFLILQEQALVLAIVLALIALPGFLLVDIGGAVIIAIIAAEIVLLIDSLGRSWADEKKTA